MAIVRDDISPGPHRIGFGCMGITAFYGDPMAQDDATALLKAAYDAGCRHFDTAEVYKTGDPMADGDGGVYNEAVIAPFLRSVPRDGVVVATKYFPNRHGGGCDYAAVKPALLASLAAAAHTWVQLTSLLSSSELRDCPPEAAPLVAKLSAQCARLENVTAGAGGLAAWLTLFVRASVPFQTFDLPLPWRGHALQLGAISPCETIGECAECVARAECGWALLPDAPDAAAAGGGGVCLKGDAARGDACRASGSPCAWFFDACPSRDACVLKRGCGWCEAGGARLDASEALAFGLIDRITPDPVAAAHDLAAGEAAHIAAIKAMVP